MLRLAFNRLLVADFRAVFLFYRDVLGFTPTFGDENDVYADFDTGSVTVALFQRELMAEAMGIKGFRVEKPQELKSSIQAALAHKGPALVDVVSARQELAMPPKTTLDQAYHFGMFTMKAVLDGRAKELIDLAKVNLTR